MAYTRPFLKWAGNKYRCLNDILPTLPKANRLMEPFAGSAAVFLNADYDQYTLGEENKDLIALYTHLQKEGDQFIQYCYRFFTDANNCAERYYALRSQFNQSRNTRLRAALFLYLNRHGYNGLCRYNQSGGYNVPFGRYHKPYFPRLEMQHFHQKSQRAEFVHNDFRQTFKRAQPGDLIYCDPPYAPLPQSSNFTSYINKTFAEEEQITLAKLAMECATQGITVIISNHDTAFTRYHYRYGSIKSFTVRRSISCIANNRGEVKELLAIFR